MTAQERAILIRAYGVLEWVVGQGYVPEGIPDPDDVFLDIAGWLGTDLSYGDLVRRPEDEG
jgi:hypothetical protein